MKPSSQIVHVTDIFRGLAKDMWAFAAVPRSDGAILFLYGESSEPPRPVLLWSPGRIQGGLRVVGLEGSFAARSMPAQQTARLIRRLAMVGKNRSVRGVDVLYARTGARSIAELSESFVTEYLDKFFREDVTMLGDYLFTGVEVRSDHLRMFFRSSEHLLSYEIRPSADDIEADWAKVGPVAFRCDREEPEANEGLDFLDRYMAFSFSRALRDVPEVIVRRRQTSRGGVKLPSVMNNNDEESLAERLMASEDESPEDAFFLLPEARIMACHQQVSTIMEADEGTAALIELGKDCSTHYGWLNSTSHCRHAYSRYEHLPFTMPERFGEGRLELFEPTEFETIVGDESNLRERMQALISRDGINVTVCFRTCHPRVCGVDHEGILDAETRHESNTATTIAVESAMDATTPMGSFWQGLFKAVRHDLSRRQRLVNFVGLGAEGSPMAREAEAILARAGVEVNAFFVPSFRSQAAERFLEAECTFISTAEMVAREFSVLRDDLEGMQYIDVDPPRGPTGCMRFYSKLLEECSTTCKIDPESLWKPYEKEWQDLVRRASRHEVAILVRPEDVSMLLEPRLLYGIDLLNLLQEMGFRVLVIELPRHRGEKPTHEVAATLRRYLDESKAIADRLDVKVVPADVPINEVLDNLNASLVFTEYPPDHRIMDAGKMCIDPTCFEMGLEGTLRSLTRLVRLAESNHGGRLDRAGGQRSSFGKESVRHDS